MKIPTDQEVGGSIPSKRAKRLRAYCSGGVNPSGHPENKIQNYIGKRSPNPSYQKSEFSQEIPATKKAPKRQLKIILHSVEAEKPSNLKHLLTVLKHLSNQSNSLLNIFR